MSRFYNRTRRSRSIPIALLRRGRVFDVPLYYTLRCSDLAREGMDRSGSWAFADHIYRGEPSGVGRFGRWLDRRLLAMPAARSFRNRVFAAAEAVAQFLRERGDRPLHVLSVPCGIPRELTGAARLTSPSVLQGVTFHGLDLDADVLSRATSFAQEQLAFVAHHGDAFDAASYPKVVDFITCTGFGEFLDEAQLVRLYRLFHVVLRSGGGLVTSSMRRHWASAYLLRMAELDTHYRTGAELERILRQAGFDHVQVRPDPVGLQSIAVARR